VTIAILYFAALRELLGRSEEVVELPGSLTLRALADRLVELHPELRPHLPSVRFAINETFVDWAATVSAGDRVALLPPVSGG
jgi:molybdopterin converting factor subunit 1